MGVREIRARKMAEQNGLCFYCARPMWQKDPEAFGWVFGVATRAVPQLQCTAEHLLARRDGGGNGEANIVAACLFCNRARHKASRPRAPDAYRCHVTRRLAAGRWLQVGPR